ncbi:unnamed protein product, partial [Iphiclides podalirius]
MRFIRAATARPASRGWNGTSINQVRGSGETLVYRPKGPQWPRADTMTLTQLLACAVRRHTDGRQRCESLSAIQEYPTRFA